MVDNVVLNQHKSKQNLNIPFLGSLYKPSQDDFVAKITRLINAAQEFQKASEDQVDLCFLSHK